MSPQVKLKKDELPMNNLKKVLARGLALVMLLGMFTVASAAEAKVATQLTDWDSITHQNAVALNVDLGIIKGMPDGSYSPKENIDRAVKKGTGELQGAAIQEVTYEGYGPAGTAIIVEVATDNTNRCSSELRTIFSRNGGNMGTPGSVSYQFDRKGEVRIVDTELDEDTAMELAMDGGADEFESGESEGEWVFICGPTDVQTVSEALGAAGKNVTGMKLISVAQNPTEITDLETAQKVMKLYELLDDYDDTMNVFTNFEIQEDILEQMS